jgi:DNA-binding CsgD family transcriptional regulator
MSGDSAVVQESLSSKARLSQNSEEILNLVRSRSLPGVLILDFNKKVHFCNDEAKSLLKDFDSIPAEIQRICERIKLSSYDPKNQPTDSGCSILWIGDNPPYSVRGFLLSNLHPDRSAARVMILVEKVAEQRAINLSKAKHRFGLSDREIEVVELVAQGLANKGIGSKLFVCENTVKDHLKNIMKKMGANSRNGILAMLN